MNKRSAPKPNHNTHADPVKGCIWCAQELMRKKEQERLAAEKAAAKPKRPYKPMSATVIKEYYDENGVKHGPVCWSIHPECYAECVNGHPRNESTTRIERTRDGRLRNYCRVCARTTEAARRARGRRPPMSA